MIQKRTIEGRWWLPGAEHGATPGMLEFDPERGITLTLRRYRSRSMMEVFDSLAGQGEINAPVVIFGRDTADIPITVYRCVRTSSNIAGGVEGQKYIADAVFVGAHLINPDQEMFGSVQLEFDYMYSWLGQQAQTTTVPTIEDWVVQTRTELPQPIALHLPEHGTMQLRTFGGTRRSMSMNEREDTTRWSSNLWWQFPERNPVRTLDDRTHALRRLLTLFVGHPVRLRNCIRFRHCLGEPQSYEGEIDGGVEVLRARRSDPENLPEVWGSQFTVTFDEVRADLPTSISRWFAYHERYRTVLDLYFSEFFGQHPMEVRFLLLAQALEVYHGIDATGNAQPTGDWSARVRRIIDSAPPEERAWLTEKLRHSNQKTLAQRLSEIVARHSVLIRAMLRDSGAIPHSDIEVYAYFNSERRRASGSLGDADSDRYGAEAELHNARFCRRVKDTRNRFTHWGDETRADRIFPPAELPTNTERLRRILQLCILTDLGISGTWQQRLVREPLPVAIDYAPAAVSSET